jgi:transposase
MPRRAPPLECSADDKAALITIRKSRTEDTRVIERAKIVLSRVNGKPIQQVAREMKVSIPTVTMWCKRFLLKGVRGLRDDPRPGKPATYGKAFRDSVLNLLGKPRTGGLADWDGPAIAAELGASVDAVWRVLRRESIYLRRRRNWRIQTDAGFVPKNTEIVGLYLNPPLNALILRAGDLSIGQAVGGSSGFVETDDGAIARSLKRAGRRHGTLMLTAAIEAGAGQRPAPLSERQIWTDFQNFVDAVITNQPQSFELHAILDCSSKIRDWLTGLEERLECHFTPTSAQWVNLIEILFKLLSGANGKRGDKSEEGLRGAIEAFVRGHNEHTKPFRWRKGEIQYSDSKIQQ